MSLHSPEVVIGLTPQLKRVSRRSNGRSQSQKETDPYGVLDYRQ